MTGTVPQSIDDSRLLFSIWYGEGWQSFRLNICVGLAWELPFLSHLDLGKASLLVRLRGSVVSWTSASPRLWKRWFIGHSEIWVQSWPPPFGIRWIELRNVSQPPVLMGFLKRILLVAADSLTKESCIAVYLYAKAVKRLYRKSGVCSLLCIWSNVQALFRLPMEVIGDLTIAYQFRSLWPGLVSLVLSNFLSVVRCIRRMIRQIC